MALSVGKGTKKYRNFTHCWRLLRGIWSTQKETLIPTLIVHNNENWKQAQWPWKWTNKAMAYVSDEMSPGNYNNHSYYRNILKTIACHLQFMHRKSFYYIFCDYVTSWTAWTGSTAVSARASGSSTEGRWMEQKAQGTSTFLYSL